MSKSNFILILLGLTFLRCWIALQVGLGVDEAHYFLYGKELDFSYFDHPPMVGWVHHLFQFLPNKYFAVSNDLIARLPAILNSLLTSWLTYRFLIRRGFGIVPSQVAVLALNSTLLFNFLSLMFLPDSLLMPLALIIIDATEKAELKNDLWSWVKLGFWLGLAGLSKYTSIFFVFAIALFFMLNKRWTKLFNLKWLVGVLTSFLVLIPLVYWNLQNHFISFKYQSGHIFNFEHVSLVSVVQTQIAQILMWGLGFYFIAFYGLIKLKKTDFNFEFTTILVTTLTAIFGVVSLSQFVLPHWLLIIFTIAIPISVAYFYQENYKKIIFACLIISSTISIPVFAELGFHYLPDSLRPGIYKQIVQWDQMITKANQLLDTIPSTNKAIAVVNWTLGSRTIYYNQHKSLVFVLDKQFDQFDIWNPISPKGYDLVIMIEDEKIEESLPLLECKELTPLGHHLSKVGEITVNQITYFKCIGFGGLK